MESVRTTNAKTMGHVPLLTKKMVYCVLKSTHVHKEECRQLVWFSDTDRAKAYAIDFSAVLLHAVSRDPKVYPSPCIYTQLSIAVHRNTLGQPNNCLPSCTHLCGLQPPHNGYESLHCA